MTYALAAKVALSLNAAAFDQREHALRAPAGAPVAPTPTVIRSKWVTGRAPSWERYG
jgi:hypothetical protein